jgi:hypothetical protein
MSYSHKDLASRGEAENLAEMIISDHMRFVCAEKALIMWNERFQISCDLQNQRDAKSNVSFYTRRKVIALVEREESLEAYRMCEELGLFEDAAQEDSSTRGMLSKLVYVDLLRAKRFSEAIQFAKSFINEENERDKLFTLIGYEDVEDPRVADIMQSVSRERVVDAVNKYLFKKEVGRPCSLLGLALNHYNSILKYRRK